MEEVIKPGDLIVYGVGSQIELGLVKSRSKYDKNKIFVFYGCGDTSACTDLDDVQKISKEEAILSINDFCNKAAAYKFLDYELTY